MTSINCVEVGCGGKLKKLEPVIPPSVDLGGMPGVGSTRPAFVTKDDPRLLRLLECPKCGRIEADNTGRNPPSPVASS